MKTNRGFSLQVAILIIFVVIGGGYYFYQQTYAGQVPEGPGPPACTQEAKICPDGTAVGRTVPNCEFAECPFIESELEELDEIDAEVKDEEKGEVSLGLGYKQVGDEMFYYNDPLPTDVDINTFEPLNYGWARDQFRVYAEHVVAEIVDRESVEILSNSLVKDSFGVYMKILPPNEGRDNKVVLLEGADTETIEFVTPDFFARDSNYVYVQTPDDSRDFKKVVGADGETFERVITGAKYGSCFRDIYRFYSNGNPVDTGYDYNSFDYLGLTSAPGVYQGFKAYSKDKDYVYVGCGSILQGADPTTIELLIDGYIKDKNKVYYLGNVVEGVDPANCSIDSIDNCKI